MSSLPNQTSRCNGSKTVRKRVATLKTSPENTSLYRPTADDPDIEALAESILQHGLREPLVITRDNYIVSGHRRQAALIQIGQTWVTCRQLSIRRADMPQDEYVALLRDHNRQRNKTVAEQVREELFDNNPNPEEAHRRLRELRQKSIYADHANGVVHLEIEGSKRRYGISEEKAEHVKHILEIVEARKVYWPLSVRGVHYPLLNYNFVRGYYWPRRNESDYGTKRELRYANDDGSYQATSDLITRLRLDGTIPWKAFDDCTRPFKEFRSFTNVRDYIRQEIEDCLAGYWRSLSQSQPNHIEVLCEKNTIYHMVLRVTEKYQILTSSGRGFNSIDPWHDLFERFKDSRKERLIVIVLSDFDPEGEMIPQVGGRTLRDDFGVSEDRLTIIKAGVKREQIAKYKLPPQNIAKETSTNHDWFVKRNNGDDTVYELEALDPANMLADLETVIKSVIDIDLFNAEVAREQEEATYLEAARRKFVEALKGLAD